MYPNDLVDHFANYFIWVILCCLWYLFLRLILIGYVVCFVWGNHFLWYLCLGKWHRLSYCLISEFFHFVLFFVGRKIVTFDVCCLLISCVLDFGILRLGLILFRISFSFSFSFLFFVNFCLVCFFNLIFLFDFNLFPLNGSKNLINFVEFM